MAKTTDHAVVRAARKLLDRGGAAAVSMQAVAAAVGVRAPSLYKRFPDRDALLDAVAETAVHELGALVAAADRGPDPRAVLLAMARAYRGYARRCPHGYALLFADRGPDTGPTVAMRAAAVAPVIVRLTELVGADQALSAARLLTAWLHGFVAMERAGAFRLGGDVEAAFGYGATTLIDAVVRSRPRTLRAGPREPHRYP